MKNDNDFTKEVTQEDVTEPNKPKQGGDSGRYINILFALALAAVLYGMMTKNFLPAIMGVVIMLYPISVMLGEIASKMGDK